MHLRDSAVTIFRQPSYSLGAIVANVPHPWNFLWIKKKLLFFLISQGLTKKFSEKIYVFLLDKSQWHNPWWQYAESKGYKLVAFVSWNLSTIILKIYTLAAKERAAPHLSYDRKCIYINCQCISSGRWFTAFLECYEKPCMAYGIDHPFPACLISVLWAVFSSIWQSVSRCPWLI